MDSLTVKPPETAEIETYNASLVESARALMVADQDGHGRALAIIGDIGRREKIVKEAFAEPKKKAHEAHKAITALETKLLLPLGEARLIVSRKCDVYEMEQKRIAREQQAVLEAEARKAEEDRLLEEAAMAESVGDPAQAQAILDQPVVVPLVTVVPAVAKVEGVSSQTRWAADVVDKMALIKYVAGHPEWASLLDANEPNLNRLAISQRQALSIPGVRAVSRIVRTTR